MQRAPISTVTRRTVAAQCKGLGIGAIRRHQAAVGIMTVSTGVMRRRIRAYKRRVGMTGRTVASRLHQ